MPKWLKMGKNWWQSKGAISSMHKKHKKNVVQQQTCEKGAKTRNQVVADIQKFALCAQHSLATKNLPLGSKG